MRSLLLSVLLTISAGAYAAGQNLRRVDFKNFEYPWIEPEDWSDHLEWLNLSEANRVRLVDGRWPSVSRSSEDADMPFAGLTLESVQFGDVTGDDTKEAIVVLRFDTGGTQYSHYVFIYSWESGQPKLAGYFHSGDRAYLGLHRVYAQAGKLVVELYNPDLREGDCCSSGFIRTRYRWHNGQIHKGRRRRIRRCESPVTHPRISIWEPQIGFFLV